MLLFIKVRFVDMKKKMYHSFFHCYLLIKVIQLRNQWRRHASVILALTIVGIEVFDSLDEFQLLTAFN